MDHFIGNWWSANDSDVVPAGEGAKGYKGATFHAPGTNFKVHAEIVKHVYDKGKGAGKKEDMGDAALQPRHRQRDAHGRGHPHGAWPSTATRRADRRAGALGLREPEPHRASGSTSSA